MLPISHPSHLSSNGLNIAKPSQSLIRDSITYIFSKASRPVGGFFMSKIAFVRIVDGLPRDNNLVSHLTTMDIPLCLLANSGDRARFLVGREAKGNRVGDPSFRSDKIYPSRIMELREGCEGVTEDISICQGQQYKTSREGLCFFVVQGLYPHWK
jgi:hypothetical protein